VGTVWKFFLPLDRTLLLLIATGARYEQYVRPLLQSADKYFVPHKTLLLTDSASDYGVHQFPKTHAGFPETTLKRYASFLEHKNFISTFEHAFYIDIDALFVDYVGEEIFSEGITATVHHGYRNKSADSVIESNSNSAAFLPSVKTYYCGGFNGGTSKAYLEMAESIQRGVEQDERNHIMAVWHDESHLNKYLEINPPTRILDSSYGYPETELNTPNNAKIVFLEKAWRGGR